jgi:hypothetical protein
MNGLEHSYRRALRWYPSAWRARNGEAMIGTLLDLADAEGRATPTRFERFGLALDGLLVRVDGVAPPSVRAGVSTVALATGLGFSLVYFLFHAWSPWAPGPVFPDVAFLSFGPFVNPGVLLCLFWAAGIALAIAGRWLSMRIMMAIVVGLAIVLFVIDRGPHAVWGGPSVIAVALFAILGLTVLIGTPSSKKWLALGSLLSIIVWGLDYIQVGALTEAMNGDYVSEREYLLRAVIPVVGLAFLLPVVAILLALVRHPGAARVAMLSSLPYLGLIVADAIGFGGTSGSYDWEQLGWVATISVIWLLFFVIVGRIGRHRMRSRQPDDVIGA